MKASFLTLLLITAHSVVACSTEEGGSDTFLRQEKSGSTLHLLVSEDFCIESESSSQTNCTITSRKINDLMERRKHISVVGPTVAHENWMRCKLTGTRGVGLMIITSQMSINRILKVLDDHIARIGPLTDVSVVEIAPHC